MIVFLKSKLIFELNPEGDGKSSGEDTTVRNFAPFSVPKKYPGLLVASGLFLPV